MTFVSVTPSRLRPRRQHCALRAGRPGQGPERDDHARLGHPALARQQDAHERGDRLVADARLRTSANNRTTPRSRSRPRRRRGSRCARPPIRQTVLPGARRSRSRSRSRCPRRSTRSRSTSATRCRPRSSFESAPGATFSQGRACWHLALAKAGSTRTFKITAKVDSDAKAGVVKNVVVATAGQRGQGDGARAGHGRCLRRAACTGASAS